MAVTPPPGLFRPRGEPPVGQVIALDTGSAWVLSQDGVARLGAANGRVQAEVRVPHAHQLPLADRQLGHLAWEGSLSDVRPPSTSKSTPVVDPDAGLAR